MAVPKCKECEYRKPSVVRYGLYFCRHKEAKAQNIADYKTSPKWCPLRAKVIPPGGAGNVITAKEGLL